MIKKVTFLAAVYALVSVSSNAHAVTLSDSVNKAVSYHPQIEMAEALKEHASSGINEYRSEFFPTLSVDAKIGRLNLDDKTTRALTSDAGSASSWAGDGTVTLRQPIFSGFGTVNRVDSAKERLVAANYDVKSVTQEMALRSAMSHLNLMRTKELFSLVNDFLSNVKTRRKNISLMVKNGAASKSELLQADEVIKNVEKASLGYEEAMRKAEANYIEFAGSMPENSLEIGTPVWDKSIPISEDDAILEAIKGNPSILSADRVTIATAKEIGAEKSNMYPSLDAELAYSKQDQDDVVGGESTSAQAMLRMGWNFSIGGGQIARVDKSKQKHIEASAKRHSLMRVVERDVRQKYSSMMIANKKLALLKGQEKRSEDIFKNFKAQFEAGKQSNLQLISARSKLFEASSSKVDAHYGAILSRLELLKSIGNLYESVSASE